MSRNDEDNEDKDTEKVKRKYTKKNRVCNFSSAFECISAFL